MRLHGDRECADRRVFRKDGSQALFTGGNNEIWSYGEENEQIFIKYISLREAMRPYIRKLMNEAHEFGRPVMRPMFYEFPDQDICWNLQEQYMFGSDVLVAPVMYEDMTECPVYLPAGCHWISIHDHHHYNGGQTVLISVPLDIIPVFIKADTELLDILGCV